MNYSHWKLSAPADLITPNNMWQQVIKASHRQNWFKNKEMLINIYLGKMSIFLTFYADVQCRLRHWPLIVLRLQRSNLQMNTK